MTKDQAYQVLGLTSETSEDEIHTAYRRLAMTMHPDRGGDPTEFRRLGVARKILMLAHCKICNGTRKIVQARGAFVNTIPCPKCRDR